MKNSNHYPQIYPPAIANVKQFDLQSLQLWWGQLSEIWKQVFLANLASQQRKKQGYNHFRSPWDNYIKSFYSADSIDEHTLFAILTLSEINCNYTQVNSLAPLAKLKNLKEVSCIGSNIDSLQHLENLQTLEVLICFDTPILRKERRRFNRLKPNCLILY